MSRCRCCDRPLGWVDLRVLQPDGSEEDFCKDCIGEVNTIDNPVPHTYQWEDLTDGVLFPKSSEYD